MNDIPSSSSNTVRARLLKAAKDCFLSDEYHKISTRMITKQAGVNVSMISYYFGNKEGLYEEMIREEFSPLLTVLDGEMLSTLDGMTDFLRLYYDIMVTQPEFPKLILKVLALNQDPGRHFIQQLLERGRTGGTKKIDQLKTNGQVLASIDPDIIRIAFVSLAMTPMLLKDIFEQQMGRPMDADFLNQLATFNGSLIVAGLTPITEKQS
jgi:AcrR family transcriptional regulator